MWPLDLTRQVQRGTFVSDETSKSRLIALACRDRDLLPLAKQNCLYDKSAMFLTWRDPKLPSIRPCSETLMSTSIRFALLDWTHRANELEKRGREHLIVHAVG